MSSIYRCVQCKVKLGGMFNGTPYRCTNSACSKTWCSDCSASGAFFSRDNNCPRCGSPAKEPEEEPEPEPEPRKARSAGASSAAVDDEPESVEEDADDDDDQEDEVELDFDLAYVIGSEAFQAGNYALAIRYLSESTSLANEALDAEIAYGLMAHIYEEHWHVERHLYRALRNYKHAKSVDGFVRVLGKIKQTSAYSDEDVEFITRLVNAFITSRRLDGESTDALDAVLLALPNWLVRKDPVPAAKTMTHSQVAVASSSPRPLTHLKPPAWQPSWYDTQFPNVQAQRYFVDLLARFNLIQKNAEAARHDVERFHRIKEAMQFVHGNLSEAAQRNRDVARGAALLNARGDPHVRALSMDDVTMDRYVRCMRQLSDRQLCQDMTTTDKLWQFIIAHPLGLTGLGVVLFVAWAVVLPLWCRCQLGSHPAMWAYVLAASWLMLGGLYLCMKALYVGHLEKRAQHLDAFLAVNSFCVPAWLGACALVCLFICALDWVVR